MKSFKAKIIAISTREFTVITPYKKHLVQCKLENRFLDIGTFVKVRYEIKDNEYKAIDWRIL